LLPLSRARQVPHPSLRRACHPHGAPHPQPPQERDRASAVGDAAAALRLKRQELASKRAELDALLTSKRAPLQQLLGTTQLPAPAGIKAAAAAAVARQRGELDKLKAKLQQAEGRKKGLE
jgi:hypothetical protein